MAAVMLYSATLENTTYDEPTYLAAGYNQWTRGDFRFNLEHPPLAKFVAGLPLLLLKPRLPTEHEDWGHSQKTGFQFLYRNRAPPDKILFYGRLPFIVLTLLFGLALTLWTRARFGSPAAILALFFYALDPSMIAHGRYAATDFLSAALIFLACISWARYLRTKRWRDLLLTGLVLGLALATKYTALYLVLLLPLFYLFRWWQQPRRYSWGHCAVSLVALALISVLVVGLIYYPETRQSFSRNLGDLVDRSLMMGRLLGWLGDTFHVPGHWYLLGLDAQARNNQSGHEAYLLGEISRTGWWYYYPVAFLVKTPVALLLGLLITLVVIGISLKRGWGRWLREVRFDWVVLVAAPAGYMVVVLFSNIDAGQRYLLLVYPFLFVLVAAVAVRFHGQVLVPVLALLLIAEQLMVAPHYLAFFNLLAGGPGRGAAYLADSNLDWGQDLKKLRAYLDSEGVDKVCLAYFGTASPDYHIDRPAYLPVTDQAGQRRNLDCVAAISATYLDGLFVGRETYRWLRELTPENKVGYSIYVYDLRKRRDTGPE